METYDKQTTRIRKYMRTKRVRKEQRTQARLDKQLTPTVANALSKGYTKIMSVLQRGCSVRAA